MLPLVMLFTALPLAFTAGGLNLQTFRHSWAGPVVRPASSCSLHEAAAQKCRFSSRNFRENVRRSLLARKGFFSKAPPPPPALWQQPKIWGIVTACVVFTAIVGFLLRKLTRGSKGSNMSVAEMYFRLEKSAGIPTKLQQSKAKPVATLPLPATSPSTSKQSNPPISRSTTPATSSRTVPITEPTQSPPPTVPTTSAPSSTATTSTPAVENKPSQSASSSKDTAKDDSGSKKGFSWLMNMGSKTSKAVPLVELLKDDSTTSEGKPKLPAKFLRAVASELCLDAPSGYFRAEDGVTVIPETVPQATRTALLHTAVKAEADQLKPKERAEGVLQVAGSMLTELIDRTAALKENPDQTAALENLVRFVSSAEQLMFGLAPDIEPGKLTYEGSLKTKRLEELYDVYLTETVREIQESTSAMLGSMMGGQDQSVSSVERMQVRAEQSEKARLVLASIFKIPDSKAEKMLEKKMKDLTGGLFGGDLLKGLTGS